MRLSLLVNNYINTFEDALIILGASIGISNLDTILGIIVLSFQIILILWKFGYKVYNLVNKKKYDKIDDAIKEVIEEVDELKDRKDD